MEAVRPFKRQLFIAACLNVGGILTGYSIAWSSPVIPKLQNPAQTILPEVITLKEGSWVGSSFHLGVTIGPYIAGYISNILGRKNSLIISSLVMTLAHVLLLFAYNLPMIFVGRTLAGVGGGMIYIINLIYIGEMASTSIRGMILTSTGIFHCFGSLLIYVIGPYVTFRVINCILLSVSALHMFGCVYIPESPLFHLIKGRENEAIDTLNYLGRAHDTEDLKSLLQLTKANQEQDWKFTELFTIKSNRKSMIIAFFSYIFQQCGGMLAALYFTTNIFQSSGSSIDPSMSTIISGATQFVGTLLVPTIVERAGRKTLMMVSTAGCCFGMTALGAYFYLLKTSHPNIEALGWLPLSSLMLMFLSFSIGLNIIPNTLVGELFRPNIRSIGSSIVATLGHLCGFITISCFGYVVDFLGMDYVFWFFAVVNALGFLFSLIILPETKGLSLSEIQMKLSR